MLSATLEDEGYTVAVAYNADQGIKLIKSFQPDVVLLDIWMPGEKDGMDVLKSQYSSTSSTQFIMMSGHGTIETAVEATKIGAWDFLEKPISLDKVLILISNIINYHRERRDKDSLLSYIRKGFALVGESLKLQEIKQLIGRMAQSEEWVFIEGEVGTGKSLIAKNLHYLSNRASQNFIEFRCANYPSGLVIYELFGYERGAFIGAEFSKKGVLEMSNGGTLYLRDVGALDLETQKRLLQVLKNQKLKRIGSGVEIDLNIRVIASSAISLEEKIQENNFLPELYSRLRGASVKAYPLSERKKDIPVLVDYFSRYFSRESGQKEKFFSDKAIQIFENYSWPGNVRELKNLIERVYILAKGDYVDIQDLNTVGLPMDGKKYIERCSSFRDARAQFEKEFLLKKIAEHDGNISKTAENIGLERSYLHRKIKSYGID
jgi:two-component system nitrogen regulation response regulator NtrX